MRWALCFMLLPLFGDFHTIDQNLLVHGCPKPQVPIKDYCIQLVKVEVTFPDAQTWCQNHNGRLAQLNQFNILKDLKEAIQDEDNYWVEILPTLYEQYSQHQNKEQQPNQQQNNKDKSHEQPNQQQNNKDEAHHQKDNGQESHQKSYHQQDNGQESHQKSYHQHDNGQESHQKSYHQQDNEQESHQKSYHQQVNEQESHQKSYHQQDNGQESQQKSYHQQDNGQESHQKSYHQQDNEQETHQKSYHQQDNEQQSHQKAHHHKDHEQESHEKLHDHKDREQLSRERSHHRQDNKHESHQHQNKQQQEHERKPHRQRNSEEQHSHEGNRDSDEHNQHHNKKQSGHHHHDHGPSHRSRRAASSLCTTISRHNSETWEYHDCNDMKNFICFFGRPRITKLVKLMRNPRGTCKLFCSFWKTTTNKQGQQSNTNATTPNPPNLAAFTALQPESLSNMTNAMAMQATAEVINQLLSVVQDIWTASHLLKASEILKELTNTSDFLSAEAQVNASDVLLHLSEQFINSIQGANISREDITAATSSLFNGFDNLMKASSETSQNLTFAQMEQVIESSVTAVDYLEMILLSSTESGTQSYSISSSVSSLTIARVNTSDLDKAPFSTSLPASCRVTFPSASVLSSLTANYTSLNVQVLALSVNPFSQMSKKEIIGPVVNILLSSEDNGIDVANLTEYIEIVLSRNESTNIIQNQKNLTKGQNLDIAINVTSSDESVVLTVQPEIQLQIVLYIGFQEKPNNTHFMMNITLPDDDSYTLVLSPEQLKNGSGIYYVSTTVLNQTVWTERSVLSMSVATFCTQCVYWDSQLNGWNDNGCQVGARSTLAETHCLCNHLTFFGSTFFVMPHLVDLSDTLALFANAARNPVGLGLLGALLGFFLLVLLWASRKDKEDVKKVRVAVLADNDAACHFRYSIKVCTGHRKGAGTTSQVVVTLYGSEAQSDPHILADPGKEVFQRGSVDVFLMKTRYLGELHNLRLWHSNSGSSSSWYVHRVTVTDLAAHRTWFFFCDSWLASDVADCQLDRIFPVASKSDLMSIRYLFFSGSLEKFLKDHLWLSIWTRCPWSPFTRVQRLCCCMSLLFCSLVINIMFWKQQPEENSLPGQFFITFTQIKISVQASLILLPVNLLIVQMFQLIQVHQEKVDLPTTKLRVTVAPQLPSKQKAEEQKLLKDIRDLVDFLYKYVIQVIGESPTDQVVLEHSSVIQHIEVLSDLIRTYICVHAPNQGNPTRVTVMTARQCHFLHYLSKVLEKLQFQVASLDLNFVCKPINYIHATNVIYDLREDLQSQNVTGAPLPQSLSTSLPVSLAKKTLSSRLPKCFPYMCWVILFAISSFSAFYMTLVSLDMTRDKATSWLVSMLLSLAQGIFVLPPLKVVAQTVFLFRVLKKNDIEDAGEEQQLQGILSLLAVRPDWELSGWRNHENPVYLAPPNKSITSLKAQKVMERKLYNLIKEIVVHVVLLIATMIMAYAEKSPNEYLLNRAIENRFSGTFTSLTSIQDFHIWSMNTLLPNLYSQYEGFITDGNSFLMGSPRVRQVRSLLASGRDVTLSNIEDTASYGPGWRRLVSNDTEDDRWKYYTQTELFGSKILTQLDTYSGGGYVIELGVNRSSAASLLTWMQKNKWLDSYTKAIFLEFNVYNANINLFCIATFIMETNVIGTFWPSISLQIMRLYKITESVITVQFASELIYIIIIFYIIIQQGLRLKAQKLNYFYKKKNLLDLSIILITCFGTALYVKRVILRKRDVDRYHEDHARYISLYETADVDSAYGYNVAFSVSLMTVKLWRLLNLNPNLHLITTTLKKAWTELGGFLLTILILLVAYSITCNLLFGWSVSKYRTFFDSVVTIISLLIGIFNYEEVLTLDPVLGALFITTCVIFLIFVVVNIFLSGVLSVFSKERQCPTPYKEREIVELLFLKLSGLLGIRQKSKEPENAEKDKTSTDL